MNIQKQLLKPNNRLQKSEPTTLHPSNTLLQRSTPSTTPLSSTQTHHEQPTPNRTSNIGWIEYFGGHLSIYRSFGVDRITRVRTGTMNGFTSIPMTRTCKRIYIRLVSWSASQQKNSACKRRERQSEFKKKVG